MAVPKGEYDISSNSSHRITSYCLNEDLKAPNSLVSYGSVISGAKSANVIFTTGPATSPHFKEATRNGAIKMRGNTLSTSLQEAIRYGLIEVRGHTSLILSLPEAILNGLVEVRGGTLWPKPGIELRRKPENEAIEVLVPDHKSLAFHNRTPFPVRLTFESNIQMGTENDQAEAWIDQYRLSSNQSRQDEIQHKIWKSQDAAKRKANTEQVKRYAEEAEKEERRRKIDLRAAYYERLNTLGYGRNLRAFQRSNNLPDAPGFDQTTQDKIHSVEQHFKDKFSQIGIDGILTSQISEYQAYRKLAPTGILDANTKSFLQKDCEAGVYFSNGKPYQTVSIKDKRYIESECNKNLLMPMDKIEQYERLMEELAGRSFLKEEIEVLSFVLDYSTQSKLKSSFSGQYSEFFSSDMKALKKKLKDKKRKSLFVLGHIENDCFVGRNAKWETVFSMQISDIEALARELGINIFLLGCNSAFASVPPPSRGRSE